MRRARRRFGRAGRSGERARPIAHAGVGRAFLSLGGGYFCRGLLAAGALGWTRGRVALPLLRRRSGGAPVPPGGGLGGRFGPGGPKRAERARPMAHAGVGRAFLSLGGGYFCRRLLAASALGRTRGRVALPVLRRRRGGGPVLSLGSLVLRRRLYPRPF